jgi:hypothetical protein
MRSEISRTGGKLASLPGLSGQFAGSGQTSILHCGTWLAARGFIMDDLKFTIYAIIFLIISLFSMIKIMATLTS